MDGKNYAQEIKRIDNKAKADMMSLCIIVKSVKAVFTCMKFDGEFPKIIIDNFGPIKEWPSVYCDDKKEILINLSAPKPEFTCSTVALSFCTSWAVAMYVFDVTKSGISSEIRRKNAYKIANEISGKIC